ncbi:hypothetical protein SKAU_G00266300 [Synaphobranchus kaupii]|uniref:Uncharacterized protein n=1 Tax=Synaphobranchus kaupii TaxID=118154 RepID=A0A9Q1EZP9_SYNKA|nr:hypothetical protein SKAU_G00266300 [Synaphobranchus kaupii]
MAVSKDEIDLSYLDVISSETGETRRHVCYQGGGRGNVSESPFRPRATTWALVPLTSCLQHVVLQDLRMDLSCFSPSSERHAKTPRTQDVKRSFLTSRGPVQERAMAWKGAQRKGGAMLSEKSSQAGEPGDSACGMSQWKRSLFRSARELAWPTPADSCGLAKAPEELNLRWWARLSGDRAVLKGLSDHVARRTREEPQAIA